MKKHPDKDVRAYISSDPEEIFAVMEDSPLYPELEKAGIGRFPFTKSGLALLKAGNPLPQKYYFIERDPAFAFFTVYENRMDLLTFGKSHWFMNLQTVAYPCSSSSGGYVTNDLSFMLAYIRSIRGCKLVLNVDRQIPVKGMAFGETLPTCVLYLPEECTSIDRYMDSLRSPYRRRLHLAEKRCGDVRVVQNGDADVHSLYLQTYERSDYKLERLEKIFFEETEGDCLIFLREDVPVGFVLLIPSGDTLVFLLCGMDYEQEKKGFKTADLYYFMLLKIVEYAIVHRFRRIDLGQTSEVTKLKFGAVLEKRYFYAHHTDPFLNLTAILGRHILEYRYAFPDHHVFK